jgi:two-component system phosphoglycerate transport system response regulator PgtA
MGYRESLPALSAIAEGPSEPNDHQPTVLVVEDNEQLRDAVSLLLTQEGYMVLAAATGRDALGILRQPLSPIDVVLLDVCLPDLNGIDLCVLLRRAHPKLPVIICTGRATPAEAAQLLELGAHRYFQKPISAEELLSSVEAALT